jgi:hypothetical protein
MNITSPKRILFAAQDMGGLNALAPVFLRFNRRKSHYDCKTVLSDPAYSHAKELGIHDAIRAPKSAATLTRELVRINPHIVLTGTSSGRSLEKMLIPLARAKGIPTVSILDAWLNYGYQLSTSPKGKLIRIQLPDTLFVMDNMAKRAVVKFGYPAHRIRVTGNPAFDAYDLPSASRLKRIQTIVFIDQHFSELLKYRLHENFGFDEHSVFQDFMDVLNELDWSGRLLIRLHPGSSSPHRYDSLLKKAGRRATFVKSGLPISTCRRADLVVGMNSAVLLDAAMHGKIVISYQPGMSRQTDPLMSNFYGLSLPAYNRKRFRSLAKSLLGTHPRLMRKRKPVRPAWLDGGATDRVVEAIESLIPETTKKV